MNVNIECPVCGNEFTFKVILKFPQTFGDCPMCSSELAVTPVKKSQKSNKYFFEVEQRKTAPKHTRKRSAEDPMKDKYWFLA